MQQEKKQLHYPNGMPVPVRDVWDVVDQLGYSLAMSYKLKEEAERNQWEGDFGLTPSQEQETIAHRDRLTRFLISNHGDQMVPQARYTIVSKEMNEKQRYYRKGEFRLFIGTYSSLVVELGITPDELDIDPKKMLAAFTILDDREIRAASTPEEKKDLLKALVHDNTENGMGWK